MIFKKCTVLNTIFGEAMTKEELETEDMVKSSKDKITEMIF
jgi:hypothetical protein